MNFKYLFHPHCEFIYVISHCFCDVFKSKMGMEFVRMTLNTLFLLIF